MESIKGALNNRDLSVKHGRMIVRNRNEWRMVVGV